mgnify:FL=1|jgi:hypothetical protein
MYYVLQHTVGLLGDFNMMKNIGGTERWLRRNASV